MTRCITLFSCGFLSVFTASAVVAADQPLQFETDVRPILKAHCFHCHGDEEEHEANLDLRLVRFMLAGGDSGAALVAGQSASSLLAERILSGEMPPGDIKLSDQERQTILKWIDDGANTIRPEPETLSSDSPWTEEERNFWAFKPVQRPSVPVVHHPETVGNPIDAFLLAKLEEQNLAFSPAAERETLIRRVYFDLIGLPPSPERVAAFVNDDSPDAYERLVDELLDSPVHGERWGRHWLDVAGYADSDGYTEKDNPRLWAYRYRDYVIRAFNDNKPYNEFIIEQLAGDELLAPPYKDLTPEQAEKLIATGFLRMAPDGTADGGVDQDVARNDVIAESLKIVTSSLIGMTVGCAQCHQHRYDPIAQEDYYRIRAIFEPAYDWKNWRVPNGRLVSLWSPADFEQDAKVDAEVKEVSDRRSKELDDIVTEIFNNEVAKLDESLRELAKAARAADADKRTPEQLQILKDHPSLNVDRGSAYLYEPKKLNEFNKQFDDLMKETQAKRPALDYVACLTEVPNQVTPTHFFYRGDLKQPRQEISPGDLSVLDWLAADIPANNAELPTTGRRLAWANHLVNGQHPLTARVFVNRLWMHHFGRGIVSTPADFGFLGERPTHPELLDWLADEFVRSGWNIKAMHRLMVTSTAYRQSSYRTDALQEADPDNKLLGRMSVRRLEAEIIRDAALSVSGNLTAKLYGPSIGVAPDDVGQVVLGSGMRDGNGILIGTAAALGREQFRRTVYIQERRSMPLGVLEPFDLPNVAPNCDRRTPSTAAPQALLMMNNDVVLKQAEQFAQRVTVDAGDDRTAQITRAWQLAFSRSPTPSELTQSLEFLAAQEQDFSALPPPEKDKPAPQPALMALSTLCQALLCSNQFLYVE
ncbi:MAG: PSD1 and planctomycete cytochrome C domain-containing protein [Planctomycetota bacterium]|nr:PSD1 and planctomycete cytochrome C domain-containing protein [Planctomycetota bacterium]MDA1212119.1 PSD1 and planctomycete cytochrome C domain-containing protein [Planctomycetota bacterium]